MKAFMPVICKLLTLINICNKWFHIFEPAEV